MKRKFHINDLASQLYNKDEFETWLKSIDIKKINENLNKNFSSQNKRIKNKSLKIFGEIIKESEDTARSGLIASGPF